MYSCSMLHVAMFQEPFGILILTLHTFFQTTMISRLSALAALVAAGASQTSAFCPAALSPCVRRSGSLLAAPIDNDDFDAPVTNQMTSSGMPHHNMVNVDVDDMVFEDECYLGKYGQHEECVDFGEHIN